MNVLIIEDEPFAQKELVRLLTAVRPDYKVADMLDSVEDSLEWLEKNQENIDLIFLDIELSDGQSFEIFEHKKIFTPIIFTTAYNEFAIKAFELNSIDYLLKPIEQNLLLRAIEKFEHLGATQAQTEEKSAFFSNQQLEQLLKLQPKAYKQKFISKIGDQIKQIDLAEVAYFFAEDNLVFLVRTDGKKLIIEYTLEQLSNQLDPNLFYRINRKFVIRDSAINKIHRYFNSRLLIELNPKSEEQAIVSRAKVNDFVSWMDR